MNCILESGNQVKCASINKTEKLQRLIGSPKYVKLREVAEICSQTKVAMAKNVEGDVAQCYIKVEKF